MCLSASCYRECYILSNVSESQDLVQVGGDEDLPQGAVALLCMQNIDVLCHAALRARATGAFLACCLDSDMLTDLSSRLSGQQVSLSMDGQDVVMSASDSAEMSTPAAHRTPPADAAQGLTTPPLDCPECVYVAPHTGVVAQQLACTFASHPMHKVLHAV